ncbi:hypothetical protein [Streptomyces spinosus]|uniref:hypothetical protein n=1 Tax=Streptomyces spinosus TaxID=2872623 RepID=UPI001CED269E|nr:hypothetical protein [Streptomyces spinosus]
MQGTHAQPQPPTPTPWPEGTIARYLTVVGAYVDITGEVSEADGICHGCETTPVQSGYISSHIDVVRVWAQGHAETCRALPRPEVS